MSNFIPQLFIGVGETGAFFTLRETYEHWYKGEGGVPQREIRSYHHFNLSQDADEAFSKAQHYAEAYAVRLSTTRESLEQEMRDIQRATAEQLAERARIAQRDEQERKEQQERREAERAAHVDACLAEGVFPFGRFVGMKFCDAPVGYLTWMVRNVDTFEDPALRRVAARIAECCADSILPIADPVLHVGEVGVRSEFNVIVLRVTDFGRPSFQGYGVETVYVVTMMDLATQACLVSLSTAFTASEGDKLRIKATVKKHGEYNGQAQTIIQRIKVAK